MGQWPLARVPTSGQRTCLHKRPSIVALTVAPEAPLRRDPALCSPEDRTAPLGPGSPGRCRALLSRPKQSRRESRAPRASLTGRGPTPLPQAASGPGMGAGKRARSPPSPRLGGTGPEPTGEGRGGAGPRAELGRLLAVKNALARAHPAQAGRLRPGRVGQFLGSTIKKVIKYIHQNSFLLKSPHC